MLALRVKGILFGILFYQEKWTKTFPMKHLLFTINAYGRLFKKKPEAFLKQNVSYKNHQFGSMSPTVQTSSPCLASEVPFWARLRWLWLSCTPASTDKLGKSSSSGGLRTPPLGLFFLISVSADQGWVLPPQCAIVSSPERCLLPSLASHPLLHCPRLWLGSPGPLCVPTSLGTRLVPVTQGGPCHLGLGLWDQISHRWLVLCYVLEKS